MKFSEYLKKNFFEPLGVKDMGFFPTDEQKARFAGMYEHISGTAELREVPLRNEFMLTPNYESGGAGLFSTVDDYMKIITSVACAKTLSPKAVKMMGENHLTPQMLIDVCNQRKRLYGYGWGLCGRVHMDPAMSLSLSPVGEFGWDGAACSYVMMDPEKKISVFIGAHLREWPIVFTGKHLAIVEKIYRELQL